MTDSSPFQLLTEAFQAEYRVNLSLERPDGSIVLTLSNERGRRQAPDPTGATA